LAQMATKNEAYYYGLLKENGDRLPGREAGSTL
jgi:hypothetical protein